MIPRMLLIALIVLQAATAQTLTTGTTSSSSTLTSSSSSSSSLQTSSFSTSSTSTSTTTSDDSSSSEESSSSINGDITYLAIAAIIIVIIAINFRMFRRLFWRLPCLNPKGRVSVFANGKQGDLTDGEEGGYAMDPVTMEELMKLINGVPTSGAPQLPILTDGWEGFYTISAQRVTVTFSLEQTDSVLQGSGTDSDKNEFSISGCFNWDGHMVAMQMKVVNHRGVVFEGAHQTDDDTIVGSCWCIKHPDSPTPEKATGIFTFHRRPDGHPPGFGTYPVVTPTLATGGKTSSLPDLPGYEEAVGAGLPPMPALPATPSSVHNYANPQSNSSAPFTRQATDYVAFEAELAARLFGPHHAHTPATTIPSSGATLAPVGRRTSLAPLPSISHPSNSALTSQATTPGSLSSVPPPTMTTTSSLSSRPATASTTILTPSVIPTPLTGINSSAGGSPAKRAPSIIPAIRSGSSAALLPPPKINTAAVTTAKELPGKCPNCYNAIPVGAHNCRICYWSPGAM